MFSFVSHGLIAKVITGLREVVKLGLVNNVGTFMTLGLFGN
jgi:hypothetical protein